MPTARVTGKPSASGRVGRRFWIGSRAGHDEQCRQAKTFAIHLKHEAHFFRFSK